MIITTEILEKPTTHNHDEINARVDDSFVWIRENPKP